MADIDSLIDTLAAGVKPVVPAPHPYRLAVRWSAMAALYVVAIALLSGTRPDLREQFHVPLFMAEIMLLAVMIVSAAFRAALYSVPDAMQKETLARAPFLLFGGFLLFLTYALHQQSPGMPLPQHAMLCTACISLYALPPGLVLFARMRGGATTHPARAGAIATVGAFGTGALILRLVEETDSLYHLVLTHYLPMLAVAALGVALGKRLFRW